MMMQRALDRVFPGMGWRPFWISTAAALLLTLYLKHGRISKAPKAFIETLTSWTGIDIPRFHQHLYSHFVAFVLLMAIPLILAWLLERWTPKDLGFRLRGAGRELLLCLGLWVLFLPVVWYFSRTAGFQRMYPRVSACETQALLFLLFHLAYLFKWMSWEFFFRGFMLFGLEKDMGKRAILVSTLPFVIAHLGKPEAEMLGAIPAGFLLCWIAQRSRSIWPGVILHWLVAMSMEFFAASFWR